MLVLNRRVGQSIIIDGQIKIKILNDKDGICIGIDAPRHLNIVRDELIKQNRRKNTEGNK